MSDAAIAAHAWSTWVASEAAEVHIRVVIAKRFRKRFPKPTDVDDLVADVRTKLLEKAADYDPARGVPCTLASVMIPHLLSDLLDWLHVHFPDRYRALRLARLAPRLDDHGYAYDPPDAEGVADRYGQEQAIRNERDAAIHAALATLDARTQRFARRIMEEDMAPLEAGAYLNWGKPEVEDAVARMRVALSRAGVTA